MSGFRMNQVIEAHYPLSFRKADAQTLGQHLRQHNSVSLIGMKRVGISNFLRFFLNHPKVPLTYIREGEHVFIVVDFNDLVEKSLYAFWMLTLKRVVDTIEAGKFSDEIKQQSRATFAQSIQLSDFFFTLEAVHKLIRLIVAQNQYVTLFFLRFDRLQEAITPEFFANIQGLKDSGKHLSYVFTSYRPLHEMVPEVFTRSALSGFCEEMYLKPAEPEDTKVILSTFRDRYDLKLKPAVEQKILELSGGHAHYLHLSLIKLKNENGEESDLLDVLLQDEEIRFLSEELFTSLSPAEQELLLRAESLTKQPATPTELTHGKYLWETGMLKTVEKHARVFSPLFRAYLMELKRRQQKPNNDLTKKEHLLFSLLKDHEGELVEREKIIEAVWPDEVEFGVSDWSIDRLVSRVRVKLRAQGSEYKIVTVITRG